jgi:hypothetical protein
MTNENKVKEMMIEKAEVEITQNKILADFYGELIKAETDKELANKYQIKQSQIKSTMEFNQKFVDYVKSL